MATKLINFNVDTVLVDAFDIEAKKLDLTRTDLLIALMRAVRDHKVKIDMRPKIIQVTAP